jgi:hypothetical protein
MNIVANFEHRVSSSRGKHEGESSFALCDRLSRTRDNSQRQLPTDHDYAVPTREYQTDQSSLNLPRLLLALSSRKSKGNYKNTHRLRRVDTVTPYRAYHSSKHVMAIPQWTKAGGVTSGVPTNLSMQSRTLNSSHPTTASS